jgi:DNA-binding transcriptional MerR regulator
MAQQQPARRKMQSSKAPVSIPDKLYFRIGDVSRLCSLPAYVLRFWETEFPQLKPNKGGTGQRLYRKRDVEIVLEIKRLLYAEGFTIAGARRILTENRRSGSGLREVHAITPAAAPATQKASRNGEFKSRPAASARDLKPAAKIAPDRQRISALRNEMREILSLLGPDTQERTPAQAPAKRATKKNASANEPTLF